MRPLAAQEILRRVSAGALEKGRQAPSPGAGLQFNANGGYGYAEYNFNPHNPISEYKIIDA